MTDNTGTFDVDAKLDIASSAETVTCGDFRTAADANGHASVTMSLTVTETDVTFDPGLAGCTPMTRSLSETGSFDPTSPAWLYIVTDDNNLNFVEITSVTVEDGSGAMLYQTTFDDADTYASEWAVEGGQMDSLGCVGSAEKQTAFVLPQPFLELSASRLALQAVVRVADTDYTGTTTPDAFSVGESDFFAFPAVSSVVRPSKHRTPTTFVLARSPANATSHRVMIS